jgi:predicted short-subunit dehydrogenase-like oxidoreductase (DUF2520 family)
MARALAAGSTRHELRIWTRSGVHDDELPVGMTGGAARELADAVRAAGIVFLAVPDDALPAVVERLARLNLAWPEKAVLHASGALSPASLSPLARLGAGVAVCHPLRAFPAATLLRGRRPFEGALFTIEGTPAGEAAARRLVRALLGISSSVRVKDRAGYHLAATVASNYGLLLRDWSTRRFRAAGLSQRAANRAADVLLRNALDNALVDPAGLPLTGPIRRGDRMTVEGHLRAGSRRERQAYSALGLLLLERLEPSSRALDGRRSDARRRDRDKATAGMVRLLEETLREESRRR